MASAKAGLALALGCLAIVLILQQHGLSTGARPLRSGPVPSTLTAGARAARRDSVGLARLQALPLQAQSVISTSLGANAPIYRAERDGNAYRLAGGGVLGRFGSAGVTLRAGRTSLAFGAPALARGSKLMPTPPLRMSRSGNRVLYRRGALTEWYAAGPLGIEQGFTVASRPRGSSGDLTLEFALSGSLRARHAGSDIDFVTRSGQVALRYGGLSATDARGRRLAATFAFGDGKLSLRVADAGAVYPLRIDPLIQVGPKLTPGDEVPGTFGTYLGASVALSSNGTTALVGGPLDDNVGAAWVYTNSGGLWTEQAKIVAPTVGADKEDGSGEFGISVALSGNGETALIGGLFDNSNVGAAWVYTLSGSTWDEQKKLIAPTSGGNAESGNGFFGGSVALSADGTTALIGGDGDSSNLGAAWVFTGSGASWSTGDKLVDATADANALFGSSVALSGAGTTALIGGYEDASQVGAAWVFTGSGASWAQQAKLVGTGALPPSWLGWDVALSAAGTTALVAGPKDNGGAGAAWIFTGSGATWSQQVELTAPTTSSDAESGAGAFGSTVALSADGGTALIGGSADASNTGAAWMYTGSGSSWSEHAKLIGDTSGSGAETGAGYFGTSVALSSDATTSLIGGEGDNTCGASCFAGAAWASTPTDGFVLGPSPVVFGSSSATVPVGSSTSQQLTVTNGGYVPRVLGSLSLAGAQAASFSMTADGCSGMTLEPGSSCAVSVHFAPSATGTYAAQISVPDNAPNSPDVVSLSGFAAPAPAPPLAPPVLEASADVVPVAGSVRVRLPGASQFVALNVAANIPMGSTIDATNGTVAITGALPGGTTETGEFYDGEFVLTQAADGRIVATLTGGSFAGCPTSGKARKRHAHTKHKGLFAAAAATKTANTVVRKLWGNAHGSFTTSARAGAATVLGTIWLTEDRCDGSYFKVTKDTISVTAFAAPKKHHFLKQGHSILVLLPRFR